MNFSAFPIHLKEYREQHRASVEQRAAFWEGEARRLLWRTPFTAALDESAGLPQAAARWFPDGRLNACENAVDRHVAEGRGEHTAIVEIGDGEVVRTYSYARLGERVNQVAAGLQDLGITAGDAVAILLPDNASCVIAHLAVSRIGAIAVPLSKRFSAAFSERILEDARAKVLVTCEDMCPQKVVEALVAWAKDHGLPVVNAGCKAVGGEPFAGFGTEREVASVPVESEAPLFYMYPGSGASAPRGYVYTTGGWLTQVQLSQRLLFHTGLTPDRPVRMLVGAEPSALIYVAYNLWGPLLAGDVCICGPVPDVDPNARITALTNTTDPVILLITPHHITKIREHFSPLPAEHRLHIVGVFGDAVTPRHLRWIGEELASDVSHVINLWTSAQAGCSVVSTLAVPELCRTGALGLPLLGVAAQVVNDFGRPCGTNESGQLVFTGGFPGLARTIIGQPERFRQLHLNTAGQFQTNDGVRQDSEGFFWFMKRLDDVMKVEGHSVSTSELESILQAHPDVREATVIGVEGGEEGDTLVAFVAPREQRDHEDPAGFEKRLRVFFDERAGELSMPIRFNFVREMPRTRSGKVERRLLHRIAQNDLTAAEDLGHLANPDVVQDLVKKGR